MKFLILFLVSVQCSMLWASCDNINIYDQVGQFSSNMLPREQNYGTCYAEASSYSYNIAEKIEAKHIHPMYFMVFLVSPNNNTSVDYGAINNIMKDASSMVCPLSSIEALVLSYKNVVKETFGIDISLIKAEADLIAILQAMVLFRNVDTFQARADINEFLQRTKVKQGNTLYLNNVIAAAKSIFIDSNLIAMPRDNTLVVQNMYYDKNMEMLHLQSVLLDIMKIHYLGINSSEKYIKTTPNFNKYFEKVARIIKDDKGESFKKTFYEFLNQQCDAKSKIAVNQKSIGNQYIRPNSADPDTYLAKMTSSLRNNLPVKLSLDARIFNHNVEGSHAVVLMGSRPTRNKSCELLIRNSWGTDYQNFSSCHCFNKTKKTFESCYPSPNMDSNYIVLACWYRWNEVLSVLRGYTPITN